MYSFNGMSDSWWKKNGFLNMDLAVVLLFSVLHSYTHAITIEKWNMHDVCGIEIGRYDQAGELHFDAESLPNYLPGNQCRVTIFPALTVDSESSVLFYFTEFSIGHYCEDTNVTVIDGDQSDSPLHVQGLPRALCGKNATLISADQVFTTTTRRLTVIFRRTDYGKRFSGKFVLKFVSFHKGPCTNDATDDTSSIVTCSNSRCIASNLHCLEGLNSCGGGENSTCSIVEDVLDIVKTLEKIAANASYVIVIIVAACFLKSVYKMLKRRHGSIWDFPILRNVFSQRNTSADTDRRGSVSLSLTEPQQNTECGEQVAVGNNGDTAQDDNVQLEFPEPAPYSTSEHDSLVSPVTPPPTTLDHYPQSSVPPSDGYYPPPPSYDEVVSNENKYKSRDA